VPGVTPEGGVLRYPLLPSPGVFPVAVLTWVVAGREVWSGASFVFVPEVDPMISDSPLL